MAALILLIIRMTGLSEDVAKVVAILIAIAAALAVAWGGYEFIKYSGVVEERARIEKENQDAIDKALAAARNFDDCLAANGVWDFRRQKCGRATLGPR